MHCVLSALSMWAVVGAILLTVVMVNGHPWSRVIGPALLMQVVVNDVDGDPWNSSGCVVNASCGMVSIT